MPQLRMPGCVLLTPIGCFGLSLFMCAVSSAGAPRNHIPGPGGTYVATAYSQTGITASGEYTHRHVVAADPAVLPIGSRIKIRHAGRYSGEYVVADTGRKIEGHKLDLYLPSTTECMKFGVRRVKVQVLQLGNGTRIAAKEADHAVKQDVTAEVDKNAVGNAATEDDWAAAKRKSSKAKGTTAASESSGGSSSDASEGSPK
jgi:3D (Asp-Asp-Asp) domain-containing protein